MSERRTSSGSAGASGGPGRAEDRGDPRPRREDPVLPDPVLPDRAAEDRPEAWGEREEDDDERYLRDRPPHW